ncbi:hypothetical protein FuraDRAFT_0261 [Pseudogulbenkiania ferrooxidans 2002]|uniref:Uncharacterized protein n=1 Tax=Pseudogulbenkiania ferrooxidans 2002 TaxID=279714 RepID=B9YYS6_9NEIS|nr:hypothetical protein FuraDRAFT_0261 [Pseudogulbenkiania ferrooxidans 2002]
MQQDTNNKTKPTPAEHAHSVTNALRNLDTMERYITTMLCRMRADLIALADQISPPKP